MYFVEVWKVDLCFRYCLFGLKKWVFWRCIDGPFGWRGVPRSLFFGILPWPFGMDFFGGDFLVKDRWNCRCNNARGMFRWVALNGLSRPFWRKCSLLFLCKSSPFCLKFTVNHLIIYGLKMFGSQNFFGNLIMLIMQIQSCYLLCSKFVLGMTRSVRILPYHFERWSHWGDSLSIISFRRPIWLDVCLYKSKKVSTHPKSTPQTIP